jgi:hypothetical protein
MIESTIPTIFASFKRFGDDAVLRGDRPGVSRTQYPILVSRYVHEDACLAVAIGVRTRRHGSR